MSFWNRKREVKTAKYKEIPFQHLAPIDSVEDKTVFEALDYALSQNNVHNIALTGNYGSGKSSILESYIKRIRNCLLIEWALRQISKISFLNRFAKKKKWFLKISLATFAIEKDVDESNCQKDVIPTTTVQEIEKSILQQIFYRKSGRKFPYSHFSRIKKISTFRKLITELIILILLLVPLYIKNGNLYDCILGQFTSTPDKIDITLIFFCVVAFLIVLYKIISLAYKLRLAKFSFQDAEIEFEGKQNEESLLNKYLDELLYFFEVTEYNVVVIEDLDRFKNTEIFIKLRELNTLLNNYEKINRKIVFVYALRDEVFKDSSRTKFFDFIIPVIPVINNQNSSDMLLTQWNNNKNSSFGKIDESFLQDIGLYVDDMRLLKNTINEFKIYDQRINEDDYKTECGNTEKKECYDRNKIFALILYKNLYPNDFALLAQNEGNLYSILQKRKDVAKKECEQIERDVQILESKIQEMEQQIDFDKKELRIIYISKIFSKKPDNCYIDLNADNFTSDEEFDKIKRNSSLECLQYMKRNDYYGSWGYEKTQFSYNFSNIENEVDSKYSYDKREEMIKSKVEGKLDVLKHTLKEKKSDISDLNKKSVKELLEIVSPENFTNHLKNQDKKFNDFIIYLLRRGYIDENYFAYISNFYANSLSVQEIQYLLLIKNRQQPSFELILSNVNNVINRIKDIEWRLPAVLNDSMLFYLLITDDYHLKDFLGTLWNYKLLSHDDFFLSKFNASSDCLSKLYRCLYDFLGHENNWINVIFDNEYVSVLYYFFIYVDFKKTEENILSYLTKDLSFLHRDDIDKNSVSAKISDYSLKFNLLEDTVKFPIYNILLNNDAYLISKNNFDIIIKHANGDAIEKPIKDYYTQISKLKNQNIKSYVDLNIEVFVNDIVLSTGNSMAESEEAFIELLNNENLATETKAKIIEKNNCVVSDITRIKGIEIQLADENNKSIDIRNLLYKCKKISPTWQNIYENFKYNGNKLGPCLVDYLNDDKIVDRLIENKPLADDEIEENKENHEVASAFYENILVAKDLHLSSFAKLMKVCPWTYKVLPQYNIDPEKIGKIIELKKISLSLENYSGIKLNHSSLLPKYIKTHFDDFIGKWSELKITIVPDDMKSLLDSDDLSKNQKCQLLSTDFEMWRSISQKESFIWLGKKIIELDFSEQLQVSIMSVIQNLEDERDLIRIISLQSRFLSDAEITDIVNNKINSFKSYIECKGKKKELSNSLENLLFVGVLKNKGLISSFKEEGNKIKIYQKKS